MRILASCVAIAMAIVPTLAKANCQNLPDHATLKTALENARNQANGGLNLDMWGSIVDRDGRVCAVAYTGDEAGDQWPGSRLISAQKANTANAFSLNGLALSTANLYTPAQPGGSLFGLQDSNPINVPVAYDKTGSAENFGTINDPLVGEFIGGVNVFGGGLPLYNAQGDIAGAIGVSGDTSCADHNIAWRTRHTLEHDYVPAGVSSSNNDQIIFDLDKGDDQSGYGHPTCGAGVNDIVQSLPASRNVESAAESESAE